MLKRIEREGDVLKFDMGNFTISLGNVSLNDEAIKSTVGIIVANRKYLVKKKEVFPDDKQGKEIIHVSYFPANYYSYIYLRDLIKKVDENKPIQVFFPRGVVSNLSHVHEILDEVENKNHLFQHLLPKKEYSNI